MVLAMRHPVLVLYTHSHPFPWYHQFSNAQNVSCQCYRKYYSSDLHRTLSLLSYRATKCEFLLF
ncbi:hypothetical protein FGIG_10589 [Fasciola gigantica]|uniref:Uncharacterized protein n=1 Tax=Fasciola gigantica TaxID=46835 RepID=A0A504YDD3_FASGI|nr:hypothetical protein FGIG_10589 [Fasciola gigantica]